ncbi:DNA polymerase III subunit chi [Aestuariibius sp. 2305UL40-4]|uniref:DNA polymerase III subunit chi n=1 Tax=Aestuariibius violaceus TaxID=3234132 RepID=UPI00345E132F
MGAAYFYHLTRQPVEAALPQLVERALAAGWRVAVRAPEEALSGLDDALWRGPDDGFLAHGIAGGPHDADQPVLLTAGDASANGARCLMGVGGTEITADDCAGMERVCILFDGTDGAALERARTQWRGLTEAGVEAQYWSQESGRWERKR